MSFFNNHDKEKERIDEIDLEVGEYIKDKAEQFLADKLERIYKFIEIQGFEWEEGGRWVKVKKSKKK